jgi:cytochrome c oxidase subunit 2
MGTTLQWGELGAAAPERLTAAVSGLTFRPDAALDIERLLEEVPGVVRAYVNSDTEMAYIEYRAAEVAPDRLAAVLEQAGFSAGDLAVHCITPGGGFPNIQTEASQQGPGAEAETDLMLDGSSCCGPAMPRETSPASVPEVASSAGPGDHTHQAGGGPKLAFRARLGLFLAACVLVLGPALWLIRPMSSSAMGADLSVNMSMAGFTPPNFSIPAGKPISVQLNNVDSPFHGVINGALHQFAVDDLGIDVRLDGKQSTVITLPALEPGSYEFYCNVCCGGKINPSMQGTITVGGTDSVVEGVAQK